MLAFLTDLVAAVALPPHTDSFALELLDLAHTWHGDIDFFDILRLAAVDIFIKRDTASLQQPQALRALSALLTAIAELLASVSTHNAPTLHTAWTIQQVTRAEFQMLDVPGYDLATPTPAAWVEIFGRRLSLLEEEQLLLPQHPDLLAAPPAVLVGCARFVAETHVRNHPFSATFMASQVGASAWFISTVLWVCLDFVARR